MAARTSVRVRRAADEFGEQVAAWRKLQGLTTRQLSERAGISLPTLRKIETGDGGVRFELVLSVVHALGQLDRLVESLDPYATDLGRARADQQLPTRVRHR